MDSSYKLCKAQRLDLFLVNRISVQPISFKAMRVSVKSLLDRKLEEDFNLFMNVKRMYYI